jgi:hypothetical protein
MKVAELQTMPRNASVRGSSHVSECQYPGSGRNLSIVIITRNTKDLLQGLLTSIEKDSPLTPFLKEVTVIDNYSTDGTGSMVHKEFPWVLLVKNDRNRGFAAAANIGVSHSAGEYIFFLNSDTLLIEGEVAAMVQFMEENPDVGICGPQLVYEDMKLQRSYAHIPSLLFEIVPRSLLEMIFPGYSTKRLPKGEGSSASRESPMQEMRDVPSLIGAAIIVRRRLLHDLGGFDERFFFFLEETDLSVRAREKGARVVFLAFAKVVHLQGRTVRKHWVQGRIQYNISLYEFIRKHHTGVYYRVFQGVRLVKCFLVPLGLSAIPFLLLHRRTRRTYVYYLTLLLWHLRGCRADAGLLISPRG